MLITLCIATCQRPEGLTALLQSLQHLQFSKSERPDLCVVVADNDPQASARQLCATLAASLPYRLIYVSEPQQGIPLARNAAFAAVPPATDFIALLDDDEIVSPVWLDEMLAVQKDTGGECIYGPILSVLPDDAPDWIRAGRFYDRPRHANASRITHAGSNNALVSWPFLQETGVRFDPALRFSGGSDYLFFQQATAAGLRIFWADGAEVSEDIPPSRLSADWIIRRQYRYGNTIALCERKTGGNLALRFLKGVARIIRGSLKILPALLQGKAARVAACADAARGVGMLAGLLGKAYEEYRPDRVTADRAATGSAADHPT